ncbi:MAG: hypothetical protein CL893_01860 [Dehalococcoidia bacterium]|nr:hypothetical protein [Dehalococcoidia bacterium]|tara:strand:+ start:7106 stop:9160 length:2055 start_codon:yes stop_codon:yes gene_type:complete
MNLNKLSKEKSEYLLQHASNPVDWYPWGAEAFNKAKEEDKPIFLSIGYSSCHWCHVMEKESFEDIETAKILNENFVSIKVDREERPDIDSIYMASIQMISGNGGWPASIFMNSEGVPFYAGTYFPKFDRHNLPAFKSVLAKIIEIYQTNRKSVDHHSKVVFDGMKNLFENTVNKKKDPINNLYSKLNSQIKDTFDFEKGGFGDFPKFPETTKLENLFLLGKKNNSQEFYDMAQLSLGSMINGGIYDQLAGGFSRYSTDREWKIPHFEKMLYDNALLLNILCISFKVTENQNIKNTILMTISFLLEEMRSEENLFYSTQDADSEGKEGEYYIWDYNEVKNNISKEDFEIIKDYWGLTKEGDLENKNILFIKNSIEDISNQKKISKDKIEKSIEDSRVKLLKIRNKKVKPNTDYKHISSWNALIISSLCNAYNITSDENYITQAINTAESILENFIQDDMLLHTSNNKIGFLEDYSYLTNALFDLYNSTQSSKWYIHAKEMCDDAISRFWSPKDKIFYDTLDSNELIFRPKGFFDPMIPNAAAIASQNLYRLYRYSNESKYLDIVGDSLSTVSGLLDKSPLDLPSWFKLYYLMEEESSEIFISGSSKDKFHIDSMRYLLSVYMPNTIIVSIDPENKEFNLPIMQDRLDDIQTKIYICKDYVCDLPIDNLDDLHQKVQNLKGAYKSK